MHNKLSDYSSGRSFNMAHIAYLSTHAVAHCSNQHDFGITVINTQRTLSRYNQNPATRFPFSSFSCTLTHPQNLERIRVLL